MTPSTSKPVATVRHRPDDALIQNHFCATVWGICKIGDNPRLGGSLFHTSKPPPTNQQYIPKHPITFTSCPTEPKFAHIEAIVLPLYTSLSD